MSQHTHRDGSHRDGSHRRGRARGVRARGVRARGLRVLRSLAVLVAVSVALGACNTLGLGKKVKFPAHNLSVFALRVGACLNPPTKVVAQVSTLSVTSCRAPHTEEVYALVKDHAGSTYPGPQKLQSFANAQCLQAFGSYVGVPYQRSSLFYTYLLPSVRSWSSGDRTITCLVTTTGAKLTRSVKGSKQ